MKRMLILTTWLWPSLVLAQGRPDPGPTVITLRPAAEPQPALKYRLVPERGKLLPGNAAIFYHRAIQMVLQHRTSLNSQEKPAPYSGTSFDEQISNWVAGPIGDIPRDQAQTRLKPFDRIFKEMELGASRNACDWEFDLRDEGYTLLLPEIQEMRTLGRLAALRAKLATLDGKTEEALRWIQVGLVMGRHVSDGPVIIQSLVGTAIDNIMLKCIEELIQSPGTPSLFWAFADRPRPFIDLRHALEGERYLLEKALPEINALERGAWSLDEAQRFVKTLQSKLFELIQGETIPGTTGAVPLGMSDAAQRLGVAAIAAKIYPEAKRALIAEGRDEAMVESMPVIQVAMIYTMRQFNQRRDDNYKWYNLPYWQSFDKIYQTGGSMPGQLKSNPLLALFEILTVGLNSVRLAELRLERNLDAMQCIEGIRLHAAAHGGKLPASLEAMTDAPAPLDPATGKPFVYKLEGDSATLTGPVPPGAPNHHTFAIRYVLKLAK